MLGLGHRIGFVAQPTTGAIAPGSIVMDNLVLWLDAGNVASYPGTGTTWTDISPSAFSCTLINGVTYGSGNGGYLNFNGMDTYGSVPNNNAFDFAAGDFTVEAWVWVNSRSDTYQLLAGTHNAGVGQGWYNYIVNAVTDEDQAVGYVSEVNGGLGVMPIGVWVHVVCSRNSSQTTFYRNAVVGPVIGSFPVYMLNHGNDLLIGAILSGGLLPDDNVDGIYNMDGRIAQFRIYKGKGLNAAEVLSNYNAHLARY
jgi:hypothetical protein